MSHRELVNKSRHTKENINKKRKKGERKGNFPPPKKPVEENNLIDAKISSFNRIFTEKGIPQEVNLANTYCRGELINFLDFSLDDHEKVYRFVLSKEGWNNNRMFSNLTFSTIHKPKNFLNLLQQANLARLKSRKDAENRTLSWSERKRLQLKKSSEVSNGPIHTN